MTQNAVNADEVRTSQARAGNTVYGRATAESQISRKGHLQIVRGNSIRVRPAGLDVRRHQKTEGCRNAALGT